MRRSELLLFPRCAILVLFMCVRVPAKGAGWPGSGDLAGGIAWGGPTRISSCLYYWPTITAHSSWPFSTSGWAPFTSPDFFAMAMAMTTFSSAITGGFCYSSPKELRSVGPPFYTILGTRAANTFWLGLPQGSPPCRGTLDG